MKNISLTPATLENTPRTTARLLRAWQVDQILKVRAESDSNAAGQLVVRIGTLKLAASTPVPIKAGETFSAQIQSLGQVPVLKIISALSSPQPATVQYLRESLPRQEDFTPLLQKLITATQGKTSLPQPVKALAQAIVDNITRLDKVANPGQLKSAIADSGTLLEGKLASANPAHATLVTDLKAQLLQLRNVVLKQQTDEALPVRQENLPGAKVTAGPAETKPLQQAIDLFINGRLAPESLVKIIARDLPAEQMAILLRYLENLPNSRQPPAELPALLARLASFIQARPDPANSAASLLALLRNTLVLQELQQLTESALNRIQANQLSSVSRETGTAFLLLLDLPIMHEKEVQNLQLQLEKHREEKESPEQWNVTINFNLPELGPIQARLRLQENRLATRFEAERSETVVGIRENLPRLQEALSRTGVAIDHLSVEQGKRASEPRPPAPGHHLLDERA